MIGITASVSFLAAKQVLYNRDRSPKATIIFLVCLSQSTWSTELTSHRKNAAVPLCCSHVRPGFNQICASGKRLLGNTRQEAGLVIRIAGFEVIGLEALSEPTRKALGTLPANEL